MRANASPLTMLAEIFRLPSAKSPMQSVQLELDFGNQSQSSSGKTCPESFPQKTTPSDASWDSLLERTLPFRPAQEDGRVQVWLPDPKEKLRGECLMLNISECPNDAVASSLSQVLWGGIDPTKVLFERQSLPRDSETSNVPREPASAFAQSSFGAYRDASRAAGTLTASGGDMGGQRVADCWNSDGPRR